VRPGAFVSYSLFVCSGLQFRCRYSDFGWSAHGVVLVDCCREEAGIVLELPDQKARGFRVPIALKRLIPEHACKVFGEMPMRT
jgi:hypothetical protein